MSDYETTFLHVCRTWLLLIAIAFLTWGAFFQPKAFIVLGIIVVIIFTIVAVVRVVDHYFD